MRFLKLLCVFSLLFFVTCKKPPQPDPVDPPKPKLAYWTIMTNPTDPMLAVVKNDTTEIEFFGERDTRGLPSKLTSFTIKKQRDTIFFSLDDLGRLIKVQSRDGSSFDYIWKNDKEAVVILTSNTGEHIRGNVNLRVANSSSAQKINATGNVMVKITQCGKIDQTDRGQVSVDLHLVQGSQKIHNFPAEFDASTGTYSLNIPISVPTIEIPPIEFLNKIFGSDIVTKPCDFLGQFTYANPLAVGSAACALATISTTVAGGALCQSLVEGLVSYCAILGNSPGGVVGTQSVAEFLTQGGTFSSRVYNQAIVLTPYIFNNGKKITGKTLTTFGGSQPIELELDFPTCPSKATLTTSAASSITEISAVSGGNITNDGGSPILERGVVWGTSENPNVVINQKIVDKEALTGSFISNISGLTQGMTYHVRAYANTDAGYVYGNDVSFTTKAENNAACPFTFEWGLPPAASIPIDFTCTNCSNVTGMSCGPTGICAITAPFTPCSGPTGNTQVGTNFYLQKGYSVTISHSRTYYLCTDGITRKTTPVSQTFTCK